MVGFDPASSETSSYTDLILDIRAIVNDDEALMPHVLPSIQSYNLNQSHSVEHPSEGDLAEHVVSCQTPTLARIELMSL